MEGDEWRDKVEAGKKALLAYQKKKKSKKKRSGEEKGQQEQSTNSGSNDTSLSLTTQSIDEVSTGDDLSEHQHAGPIVTVDSVAVCDPLPTITGSGSGVESSWHDNQEAEPAPVQETFSSPLLPSDSGLGIPSTGEMKGTEQNVDETVSNERSLEQEQPLYHDGSDATQVHSQSLEQSVADDRQTDAEKESLKLQIDALRVSHAEEIDSYRKQAEEAANAQVQSIYASLQENFQLQQQQSLEAQSALLSRLDQEQSLRKAAEEKVAAQNAEVLRITEAMALTPSVRDMAEVKQKLQAVVSERDHLRVDLEAARQELKSTLETAANEKARTHVQLAEQIEQVKKSTNCEFEAKLRTVGLQLEESQTREARLKSAFDALHAQHSDVVQKSSDAAELAHKNQKLSDTLRHWESHAKDLEASHVKEIGALQQDWDDRVKDLESSHAQEIRELQQDFENRLSDMKGLLEAEHQKLVSKAVKEKEDTLRNTIVNLEKQIAEGRLGTQEIEASLLQREAQVVDLEETNDGLVSQVESLNHRLEEAEMQHHTLCSEKEALLQKHADVVQGLKAKQLEIEEGIQACNEVQQQKHQLELELQSFRSAVKLQADTRPIPMTSSEASADSLFNVLSLKVDSALQQDLHRIGLEIEAGPESLFANLSSFIHAKSQEVAHLESEMKKQQAVSDKTIRELTAENGTLKQDIAALRNAFITPRSQLETLTEDKSALESSLVKQRGLLEQKLAEKDTLEQQLRHQQAELEQRQAQQSHLEALLDEKNRMEQELQAQKKALIDSLTGIQEKLKLTEDDAVDQQRQWEEKMYQAQITIKQKQEALSQQQSEFHSQKAALSAQYDGCIHQMQEDHSKQVKTIEAEAATSLKQRELQLVQHHKEEIGRLSSQHSDDMKDMRRQHSQELAKKDQLLEKLREDAQQMAQSLEDKVKQELLSQKEALQDQHKKEMEVLEGRRLQEQKDLTQELQHQFDLRLKREVEELKTVYGSERETDAEQIRSLQEALAKEKRVAADLQDQAAEKDNVLSENQQLVVELRSQLVGHGTDSSEDVKSLHQVLQKEYEDKCAELEQAHAEEMQQHKQVSQDHLSQQLQQQQSDHDKNVQQLKADYERITAEYQSKVNVKEAAYNSKIAEYEDMTSKLAHDNQLLQAQLVKEQTSRAAAEVALSDSKKEVAESYATGMSSVVVDSAIGSSHTVDAADFEGKPANTETKYVKQVAELEAQLADCNRAMALLQKESQQQADAALAKLQQSLDEAHQGELKKVKDELGLQKERAVEDLTKQCRAASDEYNQFKAAYEKECLTMQEQLQMLRETVKTVEAVKVERDEALSQLRELSQGSDADSNEIKQMSLLNHAQTELEELRRINDEQTLAQTQLQTELSERTAECSRLKELSVIVANRTEDDTQRSNEVVLLRKDNEDLQNQTSEWKEKACSFQQAITMYEQRVTEVYQLAIDVEDEEDLGSNDSTTSDDSNLEVHHLLEPSVQTLQDSAQFTEEQPLPDDTTCQSGFLVDVSKGRLSMETPGLDMTAKFERIQQVIQNLAHRHKKFGSVEIGSVEGDAAEGVDIGRDHDFLVAKCAELEDQLQEMVADKERLAAATQHSSAVHADTLSKAESKNATLLEEVATVTSKLQEVNLELSKQIRAKEVLEVELAGQRQLLADLQACCGGLQDKMDEAHLKLAEGEGDALKVAELEVELQQKDDLIAQLARERDESSTIMDALKHRHATELQHCSDTINSLKYNVTAGKSQELFLEQQLAAATEQCKSVQEQLAAATEECKSVQEQLVAATEKCNAVQEQLAAATEERSAMQEALAAAMDRLAQHTKVDGQIHTLSLQEMEKMQQQLVEHTSALSVAQERVTEQEKELTQRANVISQLESLLAAEKKEHQLLSTQLAGVLEEKENHVKEVSELQSRLHSLQIVETLDQTAGDFSLLESQSFAVVDLSLLNRIRELVPLLRSESAEVHALSDLKDSTREDSPSVLETKLAGLIHRMQEILACYSQGDAEVDDSKKEFLDAVVKMLHEEHSALSKVIASTKVAPNVSTGMEYSDLLSHLKTQSENMQALHQVDRTGLLAEVHGLRETVASLQRAHTDQLSGLQAQLTEASVKAQALENTCSQQKEALKREKDRFAEDLNAMQLALQLEEKKYKDLSSHFVQKEQQMQQQALEIGQELSKKRTEMHHCTHDLVTARNDTFRLQEELNSQQLELQSALSQLAATRSQGLAQQEEFGRLQAKLRQCQSDLSSACAQGGQWQEQLQQQQSELKLTSDDLRSAQSEILELKHQIQFAGVHQSPFLSGPSSTRTLEDSWQEPQRTGFGREVQGNVVLPTPEGFAFGRGHAGIESGAQSAVQSLHQMKAELSRIHSLYKKAENQRRALIFQKAYLTQQVDSFYYTQHAAFDILQDMGLVDMATLHTRRAVHTPRQHFRAIVWAVRAAIRIHRLFSKHKKA